MNTINTSFKRRGWNFDKFAWTALPLHVAHWGTIIWERRPFLRLIYPLFSCMLSFDSSVKVSSISALIVCLYKLTEPYLKLPLKIWLSFPNPTLYMLKCLSKVIFTQQNHFRNNLLYVDNVIENMRHSKTCFILLPIMVLFRIRCSGTVFQLWCANTYFILAPSFFPNPCIQT